MSGVLALRQVLLTALRGDAALMALVNSVEDGGAVKQSPPALMLGQMAASEWGAKGVRGLSVRVPLTLIDRGDAPDRIDAAAARVGVVMDALSGEAGAWRIGIVRFDRSRTVRSADGQWSMMVDYLARLSRIL
ncbi:DUF3168 domain-containing protein [Sphingobium sufflavum]|uniref:DUF3168 domain-containing protein n=1 Tax=Sphingobium sufflavum TaxID=1129547 RepID=UPI001F383408|nr:DUF3168 domain-containing protein [Sphingobium sufflavum]MCE7798649.1 DUF3168 domain-containing protein [Sphingobium sufflavum]